MSMEIKESRTLRLLFKYVEAHVDEYIDVLSEAISIPSVALEPQLRDSCIDMVNWVNCKMKSLGIEVEECNIGRQIFPDGRTICLPPVILGTMKVDENLPTICIYGHLDVHPAKYDDGWETNPFKLTEVDGYLYGRGTSENKGPVLCWLNAIRAYEACNLTLPVNVKFIFESMRTCNSEGLLPLLQERKGTFFSDIYSVCISDSYWLNKTTPCLTYGVRGRCLFIIEIQCCRNIIDSGVDGGILNEAMADMVHLLNTLVDRNGKILIKDFYRDVEPVTEQELVRYRSLKFKVMNYKKQLGANELLHDEDKVSILMHRWRYPSLSIHSIDYSRGLHPEISIPYKVVGKFSIRIVPNQTPETVEKLVSDYLTEEWNKRGSRNRFRLNMTECEKPWVTDPTSSNFEAAKRAVKRTYNMIPELTREGSTKPLVSKLQDISNRNVILLPLMYSEETAHKRNECTSVKNYIEAIKFCGAYMYEVCQTHKKDWKTNQGFFTTSTMMADKFMEYNSLSR